MEPPSTPFALQTSFPPVIFSYCSKTDGGRGEQRMWQIANFLKKHGISSFNGKQVEVGEDWMQKWLGKMPEADVCLALISGPYFESGPCKEEMPHLQKMYTEKKNDGFVVLSISTDDARSASRVKPYIKKMGYDFQVLLDKESKVIGTYNPAKTLPYTVVIDRSGDIAHVASGYNPGDEEKLAHLVDGLLKGEEAASAAAPAAAE